MISRRSLSQLFGVISVVSWIFYICQFQMISHATVNNYVGEASNKSTKQTTSFRDRRENNGWDVFNETEQIQADLSVVVDDDDESSFGVNSSTPQPSFHNTTHISCFFTERKKTWRHKIVTKDEFWSKPSCKFRIGRDTIYFHQGKAGGGTVNYMAKKYKLGLRADHPTLKETSVQDLINGPLTTLIFTVRDPVNRFVSMFNWRLLTLCHPGDKRKKTISHQDDAKARSIVGKHATQPDKFCLSTRKEQEKSLRVRYRGDPNVMAEALCEDSANYDQAVRDLNDINHSTTISQWLKLLIEPKLIRNDTEVGIQNFIAVPLTPRFENDLDAMITNMLRERYGDNVLDTMTMSTSNKEKGESSHSSILHALVNTSNKKKVQLSHSSILHAAKKGLEPTKLSKLAECCLARYYQKDYQVIQAMIGDDGDTVLHPIQGVHPVIAKACDWGDKEQQKTCKDDLRSMIKSRAGYILGDEEKTCSEILL